MELRPIREIIPGVLHRCPHDHTEDHTPDEIRESAYRRGYHQAAYLAVEAIRDGVSLSVLRRWVERVQRWRFRPSRRARVVAAPEPTPWRGPGPAPPPAGGKSLDMVPGCSKAPWDEDVSYKSSKWIPLTPYRPVRTVMGPHGDVCYLANLDGDREDADAALIAAAPELFAACRDALSELIDIRRAAEDPEDAPSVELLNRMVDALAKARLRRKRGMW